MNPGSLIDVWAVAQKTNNGMDVLGVFPTKRQAEGYVKEEMLTRTTAVRVIPHKAFRPGNEERVLLVEIRNGDFYQLNINYDPDEGPRLLELRKNAWNKLTPEERYALNMKEPT
jgi:hypothetical protein